MKVIKNFSQAFSPTFFERAFLLLLGGSALVSFFLVLEQNILLQFVPTNLQNLQQIGIIDKKSGTPYRKLRNDSLYLPLKLGSDIYLDDILTTDSGSEVTVRLKLTNSKEDFFVLEPSSIIRVSMLNGDLLIDLKQGSLHTHFQSDQKVHVRTGTLTTALKVKKGTFLIKNSFMGIQITLFNQEIVVKKNPESNLSEQANTIPQIESPEAHRSKLSPGTEIGHPPDFKLPVKLPFPLHQQVFLVTPGSEKKKIIVLAKKTCATSCQLNVKCESSEIADVTFEKGASPSLTITANPHSLCKTYRWNLIDGPTKTEGTFYIEKYTDDVLNDYLTKKNYPIEII